MRVGDHVGDATHRRHDPHGPHRRMRGHDRGRAERITARDGDGHARECGKILFSGGDAGDDRGARVNGQTYTSQLFFPGVAQNEGDSIYSSQMLVKLNTATSPVTGTFTFVVNVA